MGIALISLIDDSSLSIAEFLRLCIIDRLSTLRLLTIQLIPFAGGQLDLFLLTKLLIAFCKTIGRFCTGISLI